MVTAYIGLGGNQGDVNYSFTIALELLAKHSRCELISTSSRYRSKALTIDGETQPDYLNAACKITTDLPAEELLDLLQSIEQQLGRTREKRWGSRTLDLDLLAYEDHCINSDRLTVPHPQLPYRNFVVQPLMDLDGNLHLPSIGPLKELAETLGWDGLERLKEEP